MLFSEEKNIKLAIIISNHVLCLIQTRYKCTKYKMDLGTKHPPPVISAATCYRPSAC